MMYHLTAISTVIIKKYSKIIAGESVEKGGSSWAVGGNVN